MDNEEKLNLAKTLCYQDQFSYAIQLLLPEVQSDQINEEILFYLLQIAQYDKSQFNDSKYLALLEKASKLYPKTFCKFFSTSFNGKQSMENALVKKLYCKNCR